jgi:hypothetical protein
MVALSVNSIWHESVSADVNCQGLYQYPFYLMCGKESLNRTADIPNFFA